MKKIFLSLIAVLFLSSCVAEYVIDPSDPNIAYQYGCVTVCDDLGCRDVCNVQYYYGPDGAVYYFDVHFGAWIGPRGYWWRGSYYRGHYPRYHQYYHHEFRFHEFHGGHRR